MFSFPLGSLLFGIPHYPRAIYHELAEAVQEEAVSLAAELNVMVPFVSDSKDEETVANHRLPTIPEGLQRELESKTAELKKLEPVSRKRKA